MVVLTNLWKKLVAQVGIHRNVATANVDDTVNGVKLLWTLYLTSEEAGVATSKPGEPLYIPCQPLSKEHTGSDARCGKGYPSYRIARSTERYDHLSSIDEFASTMRDDQIDDHVLASTKLDLCIEIAKDGVHTMMGRTVCCEIHTRLHSDLHERRVRVDEMGHRLLSSTNEINTNDIGGVPSVQEVQRTR
ncbi:hypothetical protein DENSPDRAFT_488959 [Dentipellis sp. KUC8613]|nr:hypothetical protein DENSPDRAFT_488959 [Dentipellis sp. KUC8613]